MPDQNVSLHRVRGLVSGANWRATKFATAVPRQLICGLCGLISETIFLLPCFHTLCQPCVNYSESNGFRVCPFDEFLFSVAECGKSQMPSNAADKLKACCWNESHGCTFVGPLKAVLAHYEEHCSFHVVSCPRCNNAVLHKDLPSHYSTGCQCEANAPASGQPTVHQGLALGADDIATRLDELKALILDPYRDRLPALQSKLNQVLEEARHIGTHIGTVTTAFSDNQHMLTQALGELSAKFRQEVQSQPRALSAHLTDTPDTGTNDVSEPGRTGAKDMSWRMEKRHILRKLELMATDSHAYLELLRQRSDQQFHQPVAQCGPCFPSALGYMGVDISPFIGKLDSQEKGYFVTLTNVRNLIRHNKLIGLFTRWYRRDRFLQVAGGPGVGSLHVFLKFGETQQGTFSAPHEVDVCLRHPELAREQVAMRKGRTGALTEAGYFGFQEEYFVEIAYLESSGFVKNDRLTLVVTFKY